MPLTSPRFANNQRLEKAVENAPPLRQGETGEAVAILQQALIDTGFPMPLSTAKGKPDGVYGNETATTVWKFQNREQLSRDGIAGKDTLTRLDRLLAAPAPATALRFEEAFSSSGFDDSRNPPALLVPLGTFAHVKLRGSDGATVDADNLGVAQATKGLVPERVAIFGRSPGTTKVFATKGTVRAELEVVVKRARVIRVAFFIVTDKNNISPAFTNRNDGLPNIDRMSGIDAMLSAVNGIYRPQANITFQAVKKQPLSIAMNLDPVILPDHEQVFVSRIDSNAEYTVFFIRNVQSREAGAADLNGVTKIGNGWSVMGNRANAVTLAHEAAHSKACGSFGRNHDAANRHLLLFCSGKRTGTKITIDQAQRMNP